MIRKPVSSSNLKSVGYEPSTHTLEIEFNHGGIYKYSNVPQAVYVGLMNAASKGEYHSANIKNNYTYHRIG